MSIDINKIIQESVQETLNSQEEDEQTLEETVTSENTKGDSYDSVVSSAISAGLGALTFRNHYRALKEQADGKKSKWKTAGKIGTGLGAAGAAGLGAYKLASGDEVDTDGGSGGEIEPGTGKTSVTNTGNEAKRLSPGNKPSTDDAVKKTEQTR